MHLKKDPCMTIALKKICAALAIVMTMATLYADNNTSKDCQSSPSPCSPPPCNPGPYCCGPNCLPSRCGAEFNLLGELIYWRADLGGLETAFGNTAVVTTVNPVT